MIEENEFILIAKRVTIYCLGIRLPRGFSPLTMILVGFPLPHELRIYFESLPLNPSLSMPRIVPYLHVESQAFSRPKKTPTVALLSAMPCIMYVSN